MKAFLPILQRGAVWTLLVTSVAGASCSGSDDAAPNPGNGSATPYVTRVLDFRPAVGQFVNQLPEYEAGDTQETMNRKALEAIGGNRRGMISLGGFGGYVVVGFDHTIENRPGLCDFRVLGNAFMASGQTAYGSCEPGVIEVARDLNGNGLPDEDEWCEIAGSSYPEATESWLDAARAAGNDVQTLTGYEITYHRPAEEPTATAEEYIRWEDNHGGSGYIPKNSFHRQPYYPQWIDAATLTFRGTRLPQNGIDLSGAGNNYALYAFSYGYADNMPDASDRSAIDIDWAVNASGEPASLSGVDFIRIHTGVHQLNGWLGECSTAVMGVEDLHLLGVSILSNTVKP